MTSDEPDRDAESPELPPSPLTEALSPAPPDVPLPWSTVLVAGSGAALASALGPVLFPPAGAPSAGGTLEAVAEEATYVAALALGAALLDRLSPVWPRSARWATGAALGAILGLLPLALIGFARMPPTATTQALVVSAARDLAPGIVLFALLGLLLGLTANATRGLLWKLPVVGFVAGGGIGLAALLGWGLRVGWRWTWDPVVRGCVLGLVLGFAFAERLSAARRRAAAGNG